MAGVTIKTVKDGPYEVKGPIELVDAKGVAFTLPGDPMYLCRCGHSGNKPFCDGTHAKIGFKADQPAR